MPKVSFPPAMPIASRWRSGRERAGVARHSALLAAAETPAQKVTCIAEQSLSPCEAEGVGFELNTLISHKNRFSRRSSSLAPHSILR